MARATKSTQKKTKVEQREASLEKLLSAARHLFVSKGYASTTLEEIAAAVGMTKGSVYFYFGSKEAVLLELLNQAEQIVIDTVLKLLESSEGNCHGKGGGVPASSVAARRQRSRKHAADHPDVT